MIDDRETSQATSYRHSPDYQPPFYPADSPELIDLIQNHREPVNYKKIWSPTVPVMFVAEEHDQERNIKEFVNHILPAAREQGATHFALEMLQADQQDTLNSYLKGELPRQKMVDSLKDWVVDGYAEEGAKNYLELIDAAHAKGLQVVALDEYNGIEHHTVESMRKRNVKWVSIISDILVEDPKNRVIVYCGADHARYDMPGSANRQLQKKGTSSVVVHLIPGTTAWKDKDEYYSNVANTAIDEKGHNFQRFALDFRHMGDRRPADWAVHLPYVPGAQFYEDINPDDYIEDSGGDP